MANTNYYLLRDGTSMALDDIPTATLRALARKAVELDLAFSRLNRTETLMALERRHSPESIKRRGRRLVIHLGTEA